MKTEPTTKCSEQGFEHAWEDTTPNLVYATYPPQYPDRQETCKNCGLTRYHRTKKEEWIEYEMGEPKKKPEYVSNTILAQTIRAGDGSQTIGLYC